MKKLILTTVCAMAVAGAAFAQGTVQWASAGASLIVQTNSTLNSPLFGGGSTGSGAFGNMGTVANIGANQYYFMLLYQAQPSGSGSGLQSAVPTSLAALAGWSAAWANTGIYATNGNVAGRPTMTLSTITGLADTGQTVTWANGTTNSILMVGWSANMGTSWSTVLSELTTGSYATNSTASFFGVSATGFVNPGTVDPGNLLFGSSGNANGLPIYDPVGTPMTLYYLPVPEPTSLALAGLGGLSLLLLRRQRK